MSSTVYYRENRSVLSCLQKLHLESMDLIIHEGSEFQAEGPATENALMVNGSFVSVNNTHLSHDLTKLNVS